MVKKLKKCSLLLAVSIMLTFIMPSFIQATRN